MGDNTPEANRYHIEPTLSLPVSNGWASFNNEVKLLATHYDQDIPDNYKKKHPNQLDDSVNRVLPQFKSDAKVVFERQYQQGNVTQTLEPRVQYLYVPYKDQSNINNFDSALLQSNYNGLFRDRMYGGLDRIASANQFTTGVTSRFYDNELVERFNVSVGQIYYLERPRTGPSSIGNEIINSKDETGSMVWAGDTYWRITDTLGLRGGLQYDRRLGSVSMGDAIMEYRQDSDHLLQLNYRYVDRDYIQATRIRPYDGSINKLPEYQKGISQIGVVGSWPLAERWGLVGAYYFDTKESEPVSQLVGLQYNTCCWAVNVGYERKVVGWKADHSDIDNKWSINLELRGLSNNHSLGSQKMLERGILPYQRAF
ncbi:organic solvent tolerance protein [Proteus myxofaciens ATCC 19692]|uniref:Organic solvent tolerance protein n=1 Tax=Proteus myxofaciens ATCC 19692 TaxID=1354337 RepID=A0A198GB91_9GAMM|nr:organic solvent tolerance protein [Proteus myxofaciens ATCC 19692]